MDSQSETVAVDISHAQSSPNPEDKPQSQTPSQPQTPTQAEPSTQPPQGIENSPEKDSTTSGPKKTSDTSTAELSSRNMEAISPVKSSARVSIRVDNESPTPNAPKRVSSGRIRMEKELERMRQADENERLRQKARRQKEVEKAIEAVRKERQKAGITMTADVETSRTAIKVLMREEERMALEKDQKRMRKQTKAIQQQIQEKHGMKDRKQGRDLVTLADTFYKAKVKDKDGISEQVRRELTREEIEDLRMVFEMFDVKGKGYITANDVKRAASMLGFKAKKEVFGDMIEEVTGRRIGRVNFAQFLQFVVTGQGDGNDPLDAILQCFRMLDTDQKGYLTAEDIRQAADSQKMPLSNRAIREMIQEADVTGDAKVTSDEFIHIMLQSGMFKTTQ